MKNILHFILLPLILISTTSAIAQVLTGAKDVKVGYSHTCAISSTDELYCWGSNENGQVGEKTLGTRVVTPQRISSLSNVSKITLGLNSTCAYARRTTDGKDDWYCWGEINKPDRQAAQLDPGVLSKFSQIPFMGPLQESYCYAYTYLVPEHTGGTLPSLRCIARNDEDGFSGHPFYPPGSPHYAGDDVLNVFAPSSVSLGAQDGCALAQGELTCWGRNLGAATKEPLLNVIDHVVGNGNSCARTQDNGYFCRGQLFSPFPVSYERTWSVGFWRDYSSIALGYSHGCGIRGALHTARLECWGSNFHGELGVGPHPESATPIDIGLVDVQNVAAGTNHTCAVASGLVYCWGLNSDGQLGTADLIDQNLPKAILY